MDEIEALERAGRLRELQRYGAARLTERKVIFDDVPAVVKRVLRRSAW